MIGGIFIGAMPSFSGGLDTGWTFYTPLSTSYANTTCSWRCWRPSSPASPPS
jgi:heme/copper-type cytochrome/quinol oxidase subunit 1